MAIRTSRIIHYIYLGAATSMAAASTIRRLTATCGLVLRTRVLSRTSCFTVIAMSTQPTAVTVSTAFQSAVSPDNFRGWRSMLWRGDPEPGKASISAKTPVATGVLDAPRENSDCTSYYVIMLFRRRSCLCRFRPQPLFRRRDF